MMMTGNSPEAIALAKALGLELDGLMGFDLRVFSGEAVKLSATYAVRDDQAQSLVATVRTLQLQAVDA